MTCSDCGRNRNCINCPSCLKLICNECIFIDNDQIPYCGGCCGDNNINVKYTEDERPAGYGKCYDCDLPYNDFVCDFVIQDNLWEMITPTTRGKGCGILCPLCMIKRIKSLGMSCVHAMIDLSECDKKFEGSDEWPYNYEKAFELFNKFDILDDKEKRQIETIMKNSVDRRGTK